MDSSSQVVVWGSYRAVGGLEKKQAHHFIRDLRTNRKCFENWYVGHYRHPRRQWLRPFKGGHFDKVTQENHDQFPHFDKSQEGTTPKAD